jgi:hypothetical protein
MDVDVDVDVDVCLAGMDKKKFLFFFVGFLSFFVFFCLFLGSLLLVGLLRPLDVLLLRLLRVHALRDRAYDPAHVRDGL